MMNELLKRFNNSSSKSRRRSASVALGLVQVQSRVFRSAVMADSCDGFIYWGGGCRQWSAVGYRGPYAVEIQMGWTGVGVIHPTYSL